MDRIGDYKVIRELGSGGMGRVFLCQHPRLPLEVAIKLLFEQADERARERFEREAVTMAGLQDTHIVRVQDKGLQEGQPYIVMEYVPGEDLTALLKQPSPLPPERALEITLGILGGLAYAHSRGVVHRDIKPSNIRIGAGDQVKILDFGIACLRDRELSAGGSTLTRVGLQPGTDDYMSPEQVKGWKVDPRSDLFATGIVLYELLTGRHPFRHRSAEATRRHIAGEDPAPPRVHRADLPLPVCWLALHALERDPEDRPASAQQFADHCRMLLKEFLRDSMGPGPDWRAPQALALESARSVEVLAREAEHAGAAARARELYERALALDPSAERLHDRLVRINDAGARAEEVQALLREARQALDQNRPAEAERGLQKIRLLHPEWREDPGIERLYQDVRRLRTTGGGAATSERGTDSGAARPPSGDGSQAPAPTPPAAALPPATPPQAPEPATGVWRSPPAITADPDSPRGRLMRRVVELFEQDDYDRAATVLKDVARDPQGQGHTGEFLDYWRPKIEARKIFVQAETCYKQLRRNDARQLCERALQVDPGTIRARRLLEQIEIDEEAETAAQKIQVLCEEGEALLHSVRGDLDRGALEPAARKLVRAESLAGQALEIRADHNRARRLTSHVRAYLVTLPPEMVEATRRETPKEAPSAPVVAVATPPTPRTPVPPPPTREQQALSRMRAEVGRGFAAEDRPLAESAARALDALASRAGPGRLPSWSELEAFEISLGELRRQAEHFRAERGGAGWEALARLAASMPRKEDLLAEGFALLADICRKEAERQRPAPPPAPPAPSPQVMAAARPAPATHSATAAPTRPAPVAPPAATAPTRPAPVAPRPAPIRDERPAPIVARPIGGLRPPHSRGRRVVIACGLALLVTGAGLAYWFWSRQEFNVRIHLWPHGRITQIDGDSSGVDLQDGAIHLVKVRRGAHKVTVELLVPREKEPRRRTVTIEAGGDRPETIPLLTPDEMSRLLAATMSHDPFLAGAP